MPHVPDNTNPENWHRYFAMECNNRAWELAAGPRTPAEETEMLSNAHASALHWSAIGTALNNMRAKTLLAEVHALLGYGESALSLADEVRSYFLQRDTADWEIAYIHVIHAHAAATAGETQLHKASYALAVPALEAIADEEDRRIVQKTFAQVPAP